jgi:hypothetical protein
LVLLERFFSGRRRSGRDHRGRVPACCFHEKAAPLGRQIPEEGYEENQPDQ